MSDSGIRFPKTEIDGTGTQAVVQELGRRGWTLMRRTTKDGAASTRLGEGDFSR